MRRIAINSWGWRTHNNINSMSINNPRPEKLESFDVTTPCSTGDHIVGKSGKQCFGEIKNDR
jgi:hypothetical protein